MEDSSSFHTNTHLIWLCAEIANCLQKVHLINISGVLIMLHSHEHASVN